AAAGAAAAAYLRDRDPAALREAEIADVDEEAARAGRVSTTHYGSVRVPRAPALMVAAKAASRHSSDLALDALCRRLAQALAPERPTLVGTGLTTARLMGHLGIEGTLLGVDAVRGRTLVARDLDEAGLLELLDAEEEPQLICGVVGGQGALFGRGNQQ